MSKNSLNTRKKAQVVACATYKPFDAAVGYFCHNPQGDALFAARFVKALARSPSYTARGLFLADQTKIAVAPYVN